MLQYIANVRLPTEKAHGLQIMKACEAFRKNGIEIELLVPTRKNVIKEDPFSYYNIQNRFPIKTLSVPDTVSWGMPGFVFQSLFFGLQSLFEIGKKRDSVIYGRDEIVLAVILLFSRRNVYWESHDGAWNVWARFVAKRAKGVVTVTKGAAEFYAAKGVAAEKVFPIPNGINIEEFTNPEPKENARQRLQLPLNKRIALYIGKIGGWKGTETLFEASLLLPDDVAVAVIGRSEHIDELHKRYPKVYFLGPRPYQELQSNQAAADVLVLPNTAKDTISVTFTSPLKLFSYMASKRPIVASDLPSIREIVTEESAFFFTPDNPGSLAQSIGAVLSNLPRATEVADRAYSEVLRYTWEARAKRLIEFIT